MCMRENIFFLLLPLQFGILYEALLAYSVLLLESGCSSQAPVYHSEYELGVLRGRGADNRWLRTSEEHTNISSLTAELPPKRISAGHMWERWPYVTSRWNIVMTCVCVFVKECRLWWQMAASMFLPVDPSHDRGAGWPCGFPSHPGPYTDGWPLNFESEENSGEKH